MSDVVDRLKERCWPLDQRDELCMDAVYVIEGLRVELDALRKDAERERDTRSQHRSQRIVTMSEQKLENVNPTGGMFVDAVRALAAIDRELGMPEDGCNSTQATLTAIRLLHSAHRDDVAENKRLVAMLSESIGMIEGYRRAGWLTSGAALEQSADFIGRAKRATVTVAEVHK